MKQTLTVFCDSSLTESCYIWKDEPPVIVPYDFPVTVNEGEYLSVIRALDYIRHKGYAKFRVYTDSQLVVRQVNARLNKDYASPYHTKNQRLYTLGTLLISLLKGCEAELHHIGREHNPAGKELEKVSKRRRKK